MARSSEGASLQLRGKDGGGGGGGRGEEEEEMERWWKTKEKRKLINIYLQT